METFYLAMTLYPAVFRRAQEEIDRIIGDDRLPSFADCGSLPYITAICKEVLRWEVVLPLGILRYLMHIHRWTLTNLRLQLSLTPQQKRMFTMDIAFQRELLSFLISGKLFDS